MPSISLSRDQCCYAPKDNWQSAMKLKNPSCLQLRNELSELSPCPTTLSGTMMQARQTLPII